MLGLVRRQLDVHVQCLSLAERQVDAHEIGEPTDNGITQIGCDI